MLCIQQELHDKNYLFLGFLIKDYIWIPQELLHIALYFQGVIFNYTGNFRL